MLSAFKPANCNSFEVVYSSDESSSVSTEKKPRSVQEKPTKKKRWSNNEKLFALKYAKKLGVSKTIEYLHSTKPLVYQSLSISTLQYWIKNE